MASTAEAEAAAARAQLALWRRTHAPSPWVALPPPPPAATLEGRAAAAVAGGAAGWLAAHDGDMAVALQELQALKAQLAARVLRDVAAAAQKAAH